MPAISYGEHFVIEDGEIILSDGLNALVRGAGLSAAELFDDRPEGKRRLNLMAMENCMCELSK